MVTSNIHVYCYGVGAAKPPGSFFRIIDTQSGEELNKL